MSGHLSSYFIWILSVLTTWQVLEFRIIALLAQSSPKLKVSLRNRKPKNGDLKPNIEYSKFGGQPWFIKHDFHKAEFSAWSKRILFFFSIMKLVRQRKKFSPGGRFRLVEIKPYTSGGNPTQQ